MTTWLTNQLTLVNERMLKYNGRDNPRGVNQRRRRHRPELVARVGRRRRQEASVVASLRSRNRWHASETPMRHRKRRRSATAVADCGHFLFLMFYFILFIYFFFSFWFRFRSDGSYPTPSHPPTSGSWDSFNDASDGHRSTSGTGLEIHFRFVEFRSDAATAFRMDVQPALRFRLVGSFALLFVSVNQALTVCNGWADAPGDWNIISI